MTGAYKIYVIKIKSLKNDESEKREDFFYFINLVIIYNFGPYYFIGHVLTKFLSTKPGPIIDK